MRYSTILVSKDFKFNTFNTFKRQFCYERNKNFTDEGVILELIKNYQSGIKIKQPSFKFQIFIFLCILRKAIKDNKNTLEELKSMWKLIENEINVMSFSKIVYFLKQNGYILESNGKLHLSEKYM